MNIVEPLDSSNLSVERSGSGIIMFGVVAATSMYWIWTNSNKNKVKTYYVTIENPDNHDEVKRDLQENGFDVVGFDSNKLLFLATTTSNDTSVLNDPRIASFTLENKNVGVFS